MNITLHFALGIWLGTIPFLPLVAGQIIYGPNRARDIGMMLIVSNLFGIWAIIPNLLRFSGVPHEICRHWLMNIFLFHPILGKITDGGMLKGQVAIIAYFVLQYVLLLIAVKGAKQEHRHV